MTDHEAIGRVVARYCHLLDDGRWDEFAELWAEDAEFVLQGRTTTGRGAIREAIEATQPPERRGRHLAVNLEIDGRRRPRHQRRATSCSGPATRRAGRP